MDKKPTLRHPKSFINGLERTDEFLGQLAKGKSRPKSIGHAAAQLHDRMAGAETKTSESELDRLGVKLIATLPGFVEAQHALDNIKDQQRRQGHNFAPGVKLPHLKAAIPFNHALRDMVDSFPWVDVDSIKSFAETVMLDLGGSAEADYCSVETGKVLYGMQHEIGLEQILWQIDDVEDVQHATEEQELEGIDLIVTYKGNPLYLDAKATPQGADKATADREFSMQQRGITEAEASGGFPVWTGLSDDDFGGKLRIDNETAKAQAPRMRAILEELYTQKYLAA